MSPAPATPAIARFHPLVARWFGETFGEPTPPQAAGWERIAEGRDTLIAAPTGSGKTLAAFLWAVNGLVEQAAAGTLADRTAVVYVSPLKALSNDIHRNLTAPLTAIQRLASGADELLQEIRVAVRTGDTPSTERARMVRKPPHIIVTTPESLFILLTAEGSRAFLRSVRTVIVDEIHAVAGDKRGAHLALSLERLDKLTGARCQRIGLSATQRPITEIARLLSGRPEDPTTPPCAIVDIGHQRHWDLSIETGTQPLAAVATHEITAELHDRIAELVAEHRTTLVFVNTRRLVERVSHQLGERLGESRVAAHHGSLSRQTRLAAEQGLKAGTVSVVVATASLELGIDIGHVDLVCHLGAPRALATLLQRVGRSGHWLAGTPRGIIFPLTRDDLLQAAAAVRAARAGELDEVILPRPALDILAQQVVALAAGGGGVPVDEVWRLVRRTHSYRDLPREEFDQVIAMLAGGVATRRGRRGAQLHLDAVNGVIRGRRGARLAAITGGGAIPDTADYDVIEDPAGVFVGRVNEDFAIESTAGDIFLLGNNSWRIRRVEASRVRVEDAHGAPPTIPFWVGESPARTRELSAAVSRLRADIASHVAPGGPSTSAADARDSITAPAAPGEPSTSATDGRDNRAGARAPVTEWLTAETGVSVDAAEQMIDYIEETRAALGCVPSVDRVVAERFFDEAGGMQLILHAPFGARINRAWGLALRKRFCVTFDFELQAAATDDGLLLSLGEQHSFPLESVFSYLRGATVEEVLVQALLPSPMFTNRWRWNATRSLTLLRSSGGRRVPMPIQRMRAEDLLAAVFPDQVACQENRSGPLEVPDHPLVTETVRNCLHEAMDVEGLRAVVRAIEEGRLETVAVETPAPSPMSHEILNANPYAFLDDAPLEERRARAVSLRRTDPNLAGGVGALDPAAIAEVRAQAGPDIRDAEELHDHLLTVALLPADDAAAWPALGAQLTAAGRATTARWADAAGRSRRALVAAEHVATVRAALPAVDLEPAIAPPAGDAHDVASAAEEAARLIVLGWMQVSGPVTAAALASRLGLELESVEASLLELEGAGAVLRGRFSPGRPAGDAEEWCERGLLARIHRLTVGRLRREIEPVTPAQLMRFLLRWQHVQPAARLHGRAGVAEIIRQLQGLDLPAPAWEEWVLPARLSRYDPGDLEDLCLSGTVAWGRISPSRPAEPDEDGGAERRATGTGRATPIGFLLRERLRHLVGRPRDRTTTPAPAAPSSGPPAPVSPGPDRPAPAPPEATGPSPESLSAAARAVVAHLERHGASFLPEIAAATHRLPAEVEDALWELVARGRVTGDGVAGLRTLLDRAGARGPSHPRFRALPGPGHPRRELPAGRWSLWGPGAAEPASPDERLDVLAELLLRRWGVVVRELLARERAAPPWRRLLAVYRRWEAQGRVRGGRFVAGLAGEQFALPEAVESLRSLRRAPPDTDAVIVAAADPLNLVGILLPGGRVSPFSGQAIAYRDGAVVEIGPLGRLRSHLGRPAA